ncbi:Tetratricopeptide repeat protein [Labrenzia sp. THAF82]|uniref:hypothetical protein n=1 Tax=Labrenzia sp. THAF82 TaxID=2587861 RepID=UPI001268F8DF|nr:hypothetical protein [Labrenzia sp. THAF82]QFT28889.1 Tetratricopeptide repeat protein [Labrenzia sp. THAF82]
MSFSRMVIATLALTLATKGVDAQSAPWEAAPSQTPGSLPLTLNLQSDNQPKAQPASVSPFSLTVDQASVPSNGQAIVTAEPEVDESALRYYAKNGEIGRVSAEIKRLKSLHPEWEPPENIFDTNRIEVNEQPLWDLFAAKKTQALYAKIREYIKLYPGYEPSPELRRQIVNAEVRKSLILASNNENNGEVIRLAVENPDLLVCREIDVIWRTAKALLSAGQELKALEAYKYILANCSDEQERIATVQKAAELLPRNAVEQLVQMGRTRLDGQSEFNQVYLNILRGEIGNGAADITALVDTSDLEALGRAAKSLKNPEDAELLGWYFYSREDYKIAETWFRTAHKMKPTVKSIEGIVVSLKEAGSYEEAEELAYKNRRRDPLILKAYLEVVAIALIEGYGEEMEFKRLSRFANVIQDAESPIAAQVLGWHFYEMHEFEEAEIWFDKSMQYQPNEAAVLGLVVVAQRTKQKNRERQLVAEWSGDFPALRTVATKSSKSTVVTSRKKRPTASRSNSAIRSAEREMGDGDWRGALTYLERNAAGGRESRKAKLMRAWSLYHTGKSKEAHRLFAEADKARSTKETRQGKWFSEKKMYKYQ